MELLHDDSWEVVVKNIKTVEGDPESGPNLKFKVEAEDPDIFEERKIEQYLLAAEAWNVYDGSSRHKITLLQTSLMVRRDSSSSLSTPTKNQPAVEPTAVK